MDRPLTVDEAAGVARRHPVTIRKALLNHELCGFQRTKGGRWLVQPAQLAAYMRGEPCEHKSNVTPIQRLQPRKRTA